MANPTEMLRLIEQNGNRIFKVTFKRRTDKKDHNGKVVARKGDLRTMVCRIKVRAHLRPGHDPSKREEINRKNQTLTVYEMAGEDSGWKTIPLDSITELVVHQ